jgi:hypothetical protein
MYILLKKDRHGLGGQKRGWGDAPISNASIVHFGGVN